MGGHFMEKDAGVEQAIAGPMRGDMI